MQPGVETVRIAETRQVMPGGQQRFLEGILGAIDVAENPLCQCVESVATTADQVGVCLPVTVPCRLDQIDVHRDCSSLAPFGGAVRTLWRRIAQCPSIFGKSCFDRLQLGFDTNE